MFTTTTATFGSITNKRNGVDVSPMPNPTALKIIEPNNIADMVIIISRPNIGQLFQRHYAFKQIDPNPKKPPT